MPSNDRSRKAWVRKHQPSYWSMMFGRDKKKDRENDRERGSTSRRAEAPSSDMFRNRSPDPHQQHFPDHGQQQFSSHGPPPPHMQHPASSSLQGPPPSRGRDLHPNEMRDHLTPRGQSETSEIPRGEPPSEYDDHGDASTMGTRGSGMGADASAGKQPSYGHPWSPETKVYETQRTRRN